MSLHLTPEMLEAAYELLRATPPFNKWKLPHADEVEFHVYKKPKVLGDHFVWNDRRDQHVIRINFQHNTTLAVLHETMAHEMCHMHEFRKYKRTAHGRIFKRLAAQVCRHHGFTLETF